MASRLQELVCKRKSSGIAAFTSTPVRIRLTFRSLLRDPFLSTQLHAELDNSMPREPSSSTILAGVPSAFALDLKRLQDVLVAAFVLLTLAPLLALVALLIKLQDGGPIFYRRRVIGQRGEFDAFKFRSMHVNAEAILKQNPSLRREFERNFKLRSDPRVTKLGAWLRKYSIDELPQLVNVLRGEMSLVGPRMITVPELNKYGESRALLLTVKPGLTGYWQVYGRQDVAYDERVRMDVFYIRNWSLLLDLKLLLLTPVRVLKAAGAH